MWSADVEYDLHDDVEIAEGDSLTSLDLCFEFLTKQYRFQKLLQSRRTPRTTFLWQN